MIKHYITIASRNFFKYKLQTLISIIGLAIGLVSFTYGINWLNYETSYDGFYPKSKQMYTIYGINKQTGKIERRLPLILARKLKQDFPEVKETTQRYSNAGSPFKYNDTRLPDPDEIFIDENFFSFFPRKVICGRQVNLLQSIEEIVVTQSFATKYFKSPEEALGKVLKNGYRKVLTIVSVIEDAPINSSFQANVFELDLFDRDAEKRVSEANQWNQSDVEIYLMLEEKASPAAFEKKIRNYLTENKYNETMSLKMIPLTDIRHTFGSELSFNLSYIQTFAITGLLLLLCIFFNFVNLLINRVYQRMKEIKLRSAIGAGKKELIVQLLTELTLQMVIAYMLAFCLMEITAEPFRQAFETSIEKFDLYKGLVINTLLSWCILVAVTLPLLLRFIRTASLLISGGVSPHQKGSFRKVSMTMQLGICLFFMMSTFIMVRQISLMKQKDLGFEKDGLIFMIMTARDREGTSKEIASLPIVESLTAGGIFSIEHEPRTQNEVDWEERTSDYAPNFQVLDVGEEFLDAFKIPLLKGQFFSESNSSDGQSRKAVINEEAARIMGMNDPIGKIISTWDGSIRYDGVRGRMEVEIIGVVKNFQSASLHNKILPVIMILDTRKWESYTYFARVKPENEQVAVKAIRQAFEKHKQASDSEPKIQTMNEIFNQLNKSEDASLLLFSLLAMLCLFISVFGLYSVSASNITQRRKEVAVRKVMGASSRTIIGMFFREYLTIVVIANLVALPLAWLFMHSWLEQYPFRISIHFWMYAAIFLLTVVLIICTVLYQTLKAAKTNPAETIKSE